MSVIGELFSDKQMYRQNEKKKENHGCRWFFMLEKHS